MNTIRKEKLKEFLTNIKVIVLKHYTDETKKNIFKNLKYCKKLEILNCTDCTFDKLTELPELPNTLKVLSCQKNKLTELPKLPNSLIVLDCFANELTKLPELPNSLNILNCWNNNLTELPKLPNSLTRLYCNNNNLTRLSKLPNTLKQLNCSNNELTELPELPNSLNSLLCFNNNLIELPDLPKNCFDFSYDYKKINYPKLDYEEDQEDEYYLVKLEIKIINKTNLKNRIIKRIKLLNRNVLLEWSARICMNPKRIQRLLDNHEIDFFDGSFDTLTY